MKKTYHRLFKQDTPNEPTEPNDEPGLPRYTTGEHRGGAVYVLDERIEFAVQVAQKTGRPLLLQGPAGSGKSSLAPYVANALGARFYSFTVTARTQARDLMWTFDALERLNDANVAAADPEARKRVRDISSYVEPRELWWALNRNSARRFGDDPAATDPENPDGPALVFDNDHDVVLLIDEIDKADPDVPNNLLEVLGSGKFTVEETGEKVRPPEADEQFPLIVITTNNERELPNAFLRRCIALHLDHKNPDELRAIAERHFGAGPGDLYKTVADKLVELRQDAERKKTRAPSTAEYLDALRVCLDLEIGPYTSDAEGARLWKYLVEVGLRKTGPDQPKKPASIL